MGDIKIDSAKIYNVYQVDLKKIRYIYHIGDIHIRLNDRIDEYRGVFERLYKSIESYPDKDQSVIVIAGDIFDAKTNLKTESLELFDKLMELLRLMPIVIIAGNHDGNMTNNNKKDALSYVASIYERLYDARYNNIHKLYYLNQTGIYESENLIIGVRHIFDYDKKLPDLNDELIPERIRNSIKTKIAIHHDTISGATTDIGAELTSDNCLSIFDSYHYGLLGDIHKHQYLDGADTVAYCGSLIQQNFGETMDKHGYLKWDLDTGKSELVEIENDYGYITINLEKDENKTIMPKKMPKNLNVRIYYKDCSEKYLSKFKKQMNKKYNILKYVEEPIIEESKNIEIDVLAKKQEEYENALINFMTDRKIDVKYHDIIKNHMSKIFKELKRESVMYRIKKLWISNILCYGEDNLIDFDRMKQRIGIFSKNYTGKSTIIDCICECLFDMNIKGIAKKDMLRHDTTKGYIRLILDINGNEYEIEKIYQRNKTTLLNLYHIKNNKKTLLNGDTLNETVKMIRENIGSIEKFKQIDCITQNDNNGIADMSKDMRKKFLKEVLCMNDGIEIYKKIKEQIVELKNEIKYMEKDNEKNLEMIKGKRRKEEIIVIEERLTQFNINKREIMDRIINIDDSIFRNNKIENMLIDIDSIEKENKGLSQKIENLDKKMKDIHIDEKYHEKHNEFNINKMKRVTEKEFIMKQLKEKKYNIRQYDIEKNSREYERIKMEYENIMEEYNKLNMMISSIDNDIDGIEINYDDKIENKNKEWTNTRNIKMKELMNGKRAKRNIKNVYRDIYERYEQIKQIYEEREEQERYERIIEAMNKLDKMESIEYNEKCGVCVKKNKVHIDEKNRLMEIIGENNMDEIKGKYQTINWKELEREKINIERIIEDLEYNKIAEEENNRIEKEYNKIANERNEEYEKYKKDMEEKIKRKTEYEKEKKNIMNKINKLGYENMKKKYENIVTIMNEINENRKKIEENNDIDKKIQEIYSDIELINEEVDDNYIQNNILHKLMDNYKLEIEKYKNMIDKNDRKIIEAKEMRERYEIFKNNCRIRKEIEIIDDENMKMNIEKSLIDKDIKEIERINEDIIRNNDKLIKKYEELETNKVLEIVFDKNGITEHMLRETCKKIIIDINKLTKMICDYEFLIDEDFNYKIKKGNCVYNIENASGAEKLVLNISFRIIISGIRNISRMNMMIIDESFVSFDVERRNMIESIIKMILSRYEKVIVISHMEEIRGMVEDRIEIERRSKDKEIVSYIR
jgi:DNA repair exonuclease SbcCD ATPase subunit